MYDLAIIGGGPAGYSAAFEAARYNMSVVLFEKDSLPSGLMSAVNVYTIK